MTIGIGNRYMCIELCTECHVGTLNVKKPKI